MQRSAIQQTISPIIEPSLTAMGYKLVRIIWLGSDSSRILQIMAERLDSAEMTVDDCSEISHMVSALLDVHDPIESAYELEVSSPGVDRPLMDEQDFKDFIGFDVKVEMAIPQNGRRRYRSNIAEVTEEMVILKNGGEVFELPFAEMGSAKLALTDELMNEMAQRAEQKLQLKQNEVE